MVICKFAELCSKARAQELGVKEIKQCDPYYCSHAITHTWEDTCDSPCDYAGMFLPDKIISQYPKKDGLISIPPCEDIFVHKMRIAIGKDIKNIKRK